MAVTIIVPDFPFTSHYYPEVLEDLISRHRAEVPELSDEDPAEPHIQLLRSNALSTHYNNVLLDLCANEMYLPTLGLRASLRNLLALIDVKLAQAAPAVADILFKLTRIFTVDTIVAPQGSLFATEDTRTSESVEFEVLADLTTSRTDLVGAVYAFDGATYTDHTAEAQSPSGGFVPGWGAAPSAGDILYIGHPDTLWDQINLFIATAAVNIVAGVWEYYDGNLDQGHPDSVTNLGSTLRMIVNFLPTGAIARVRSVITGAFEDCVVTVSAPNNIITTTTFLGQASPSTTASDYIVGTAWQELDDLVDGSANMTVAGGGGSTVSYSLPQTVLQNWRKTMVGTGILALEAYWIRFRVVSVGVGPTKPTINEIQISQGKQYMVTGATQGISREDNPLGSSDGTAGQQFTLSNAPVIDDSNLRVFVTEGTEKEYTRVDNFLSSNGVDRHFTADFDDDGNCIITFGDGTNGKIPSAGTNNIRTPYRTMKAINGNVGAGTITVNRSGIAFISTVTNPRAAAGYTAAEGSTDESIVFLKLSGPASLRARGRATSPDDVTTLTVGFKAPDGSKPFARCLTIEEAFGLKTIEAVVVGNGGTGAAQASLDALALYFNGDDDTRGVVVMNQQVMPTNFTPKVINVTVTVTGGSLTAITTALTVLLHPLAVKANGDYAWKFGQSVTLAKLNQAIMDTDGPTNAVITVPAADTALATRELPTVGTLNITVNP